MSVQINVAANQAALTASIQAGVQAYNQRFAQNNQLNLTINPRAFSQPLGRITGDVKDFEAALAASNARVIAFGASTAVLGGVIRSFKELANVTIEVEKNLADINRVFGLTTSQLQKFSTDLFNVTKQTASSFNDASQAALEFSRQGLKAEETLQRTKDALTLTRLAGISTANAVDALTSTVNGFAATGITTSQILNKLVAVEQDFAVGAGDLAEALSRTGQAAQEAGVSLDQLNALVTSAQQSTARGGAVIGNALKTIFTRLQRTDTLDQLEAFNISVRDVQGNILPAVTILQNFAGAYKNLADAQRAQLSEQVAGVYQVNILKAIVNDLNKSQGVYAGALQRGAMATNEAEVATAKLNQTLDALLKQTATSTQQLANNIGKVTFEPLARYGTEQLKSLVESMNEILEGEGIGSTFANGLLKGIRNILAGPGAIAAFFTLFKLIQNSFTYLTQALPQIAGITTETQNRKNIEQSILQIMAQQGPVAQALAGTMGNQAAQAQLLLQVARQQTAEYQTQTALARQLAAQLAGQGVRVRGSGGLQVTRAGGYIPASTKLAEVVGAQAGGYSPGRVVPSPVGGVMNTAEDVKYIPGFAQPFINPPANSKAGRAHRQNAINRTGVDPYMASGFLPNFSNPKDVINQSFTGKLNSLKITSNTEKKEIQEVADLEIVKGIGKNAETINDNIAGTGIRYDVQQYQGSKTNEKYREEAAKLALSGKIDKITKAMPNNKKSLFNGKQWQDNLQTLKDNKIDLTNTALLSTLKLKVPSLSTGKMIDFGKQYTGLLNALSGEAFERDIAKKESNFKRSKKGNARLDFIYINEDQAYSGGEAKLGNVTLGNLVAKAIESTGRTYDNGDPDEINFSKPIKLFVPEKHKLLNKGFIPNFSPLIDDNARNKHDFPGGVAMLPIPDKAIQNIIDRQKKRQMTFLDFDRTLVRTMGDIAYSRVSPDKRQGVLNKMFEKQEARLSDIKNSKLTQFGELLRQKINAGLIDPDLLGIMTASGKVEGMPEFISNVWKIPKANQVFRALPGTKEARLADLGVSASGFIPNFAPPTSAMRIPWFKKFGNASFDAIQPTLGISKANDTDTFRSSQFRSKAFDKAAIDGDPNLFAPLYEDFAFKAMQLISQSDIKDDLMRGYVLQPGTDQKQAALDAVYRKKGIGVEYKGYPKKNLTGTIGGELKRKYETLSKTNPEEAAKLQELIIVFNEVGHENQLPSDFGKNFSQLAGTSYSEMVKNSPDLVKGLSAETDSLLNSYVKNPAFLAMAAANGFVPNFGLIGDRLREAYTGSSEKTTNEVVPFVLDSNGKIYSDGKDVHHEQIVFKNKIKKWIRGYYGISNSKTQAPSLNFSTGSNDPSDKIFSKYTSAANKLSLLDKLKSIFTKAKTVTASQKIRDSLITFNSPDASNLFSKGFIPNFANYNTDALERMTMEFAQKGKNGATLQDFTQFVIDLNNNKYGVGDSFHKDIIAKNFGEIVSDNDLVSPRYANTYLKGSYDKNSGKVIYYKSKIQELDPLFERKYSYIKTAVEDKLRKRFPKPVQRIQKPPSQRFRDQHLYPSEENHFNNGFIPNLASGTDIYKGYAFNNTGKIYNDLYHSDAWDSIEGSTAGAIKYAYHNNKLLLQTNKAISPILKKAFLSRGVPESAFSPVEDVDSMMRSKNKQEIDDKLKNLGSVQLSSGIQAILEKGYYRKLIKGQQFYNIPGGVSPEELKIFGGVDGWVKYQEQNYGPLKWGSYASGFIPNLANFIDVDTLGKNSVHYSGDLMKLIKDIEASIGRNLSSGELRFLTNPKTNLSKLNDPKVLNKFINSERKGGFAGFANGFVPNFAYKQAVMGLEESMSGNKAIFDTKPFPHIRNSSQPTFSSAISDHGGLSNALSDSMRGQKAAGLMSRGFIPNFADSNINVRSLLPNAPKSWSASIDKAQNALMQLADELLKNKTKVSQYSTELAKVAANNKVLNSILPQLEKQLIQEVNEKKKSILNQKLSSVGTTLAIAGPLIAGQLEQMAFGNRQRTEMTAGERVSQSVLSSGLTSVTTGASIGASFGPWGAAIGAAAGAAVGLAQALGAASLSADEFAKIAEEYKSATQQNVSAGQSYIDSLKILGSSTDPEIIKKASTSLELNFKNIKDVKLQDAFKAAGNDVDKLTKALSTYEQKRGRIEAQKSSLAQSKALAGLDIKDLGKRGYATVKSGPRNAIDIAANEANFSMMASEYSTFFDNINSLTADQYKELKEALNKMEFTTGNVDEANLRKVLMTFSQLDKESVDYLVGIGENITEVGSTAGRVLRNNLDKVREAYKKNLEQGKGVLSPEEKLILSNFAEFRKNLLNTISDDLNNATQALKSFDSGTSLAQLVPTKLKEINDLVSNSILNNLDTVRGLSFKQAQAKTTAQFQTQEFNRLTTRTVQEQGLKTTQANTLFKSQATQAILGSELIPGISSQEAIQEFLSQGTGFDKQGIKSFATKLAGKNNKEVEALSSKLEGILIQFKESTREIESQTKYKLQELSYNQVINKLNEITILKQIDLEKEKLKITLGQKDAANGLRDAVEKAKIAANERLELTRIQTGGEFRYLGLNKRQEFESRQVDLKSIFDQEQVIAENQAIADARRSIIEIAAQNANTEAQNKNTEALFDSIDSNSANFEYLGKLFSNLPDAGMKEVGAGFVSAAQEAKAKNKFNREQFKQSRESIQFAKLSNFGVQDNSTVGDTIAKLRTKMEEKNITEEAKISIQETITTLEIASKQIGSNATIFEAKSAQMRQDFEQSAGFINNMVIGFNSLGNQADVMVDQLGRNLPSMFADGLVDGIKAAIRESDNLGEALMSIAAKFLDEISTTLMRSSVYQILGSMGIGSSIPIQKQRGGVIRAQSGMYISGSGSGDKYPALLENGEYVLNRRAVMAMGGPASLDQLNFAMAPRFASGGSFGNEFTDLKSMESNMTSYGMENSKLYNELRDAEVSAAEERRRKAFARKQQRAALIGSVVAAVASIGLAQGMSNFSQNAQAKKAQTLSGKLTSGAALTKAESASIKPLMDKGFINSYGQYAGPQPQTGFRSFISKPFYSSSIYGANPYAPAFASDRKQSGGLIGSRLSDTIPGYMEGGLYNTPIVKRYGVGMQFGGASPISNSNSNVVNTTNATNSFNFNTNVSRDGTIEVGSNSTSYAQQDVALSKNLNSKVYAVVLDAIKNEQRFGGSLAGTRQG